jgi:Tfp pilus assembly protein PilX
VTTRLRQRGATLIVALIILLLLALLGLGAFHTSINDLKTSGNMQARNEALNAAQETIETVISTRQFVSDPANALTTPCGAANTLCTDLDGDGVAEYRTRLNPMPSCVSKKVIKVLDLNVATSEDLGCAVGQSQQFGIVGLDASAGDSLCASTVWQVTAEATSVRSDAKVTVSQGVGLRIATDELTAACI